MSIIYKLLGRVWLTNGVLVAISAFLFMIVMGQMEAIIIPLSAVAALVTMLPGMIGLWITLSVIQKISLSVVQKTLIYHAVCFFIAACYGTAVMFVGFGNVTGRGSEDSFLIAILLCYGINAISYLINIGLFNRWFSRGNILQINQPIIYNLKNKNMESETELQPQIVPSNSNKFLFKGLIIGALSLLLLIPAFLIQNLVREREERHEQVVQEVSSKWANGQTVSGPYISIPYKEIVPVGYVRNNDASASEYTETAVDVAITPPAVAKTEIRYRNLIIPASSLKVTGEMQPEERKRSIYKVLLYTSNLHFDGNFKWAWPGTIDQKKLQLDKARLCFSLSDFKGIQEEVVATYNGTALQLDPGLPGEDMGNVGLSTQINLSEADLTQLQPFSLNIKLKGSSYLHFLPLASASTFSVSSPWPSPSFDGNSLPDAHAIKDSGFNAQWSFNRANLPFGAVIKDDMSAVQQLAFGVSMVQPAGQYNKTMRSVKYAILIIGLSFLVFFIIEIFQKKPLHAFQYVLVGMALVIFYTLLLSISEYILFDLAYLISAAATVSLIVLYAKGHFGSWKPAAIFGVVLSALYGFIFTLIRLEDTALLLGSIGLFIVLAIVMWISRKINFNQNETQPVVA